MFGKIFVTEGAFFEVNERYKESFVNLLLGCYLYVILHTSPTVKISKNVLKSAKCGCF